MSLSERPTHEGRPRLTLPKVAKPGPASASYDVRKFSNSYLSWKLGELAQILSVDAELLAPIARGRVPIPLRVGIRADLIARYPAADTARIGRWLAQWCSTDQYQRQLATGGPRFDLEGAPAGEITREQAEKAATRLAGAATSARLDRTTAPPTLARRSLMKP